MVIHRLQTEWGVGTPTLSPPLLKGQLHILSQIFMYRKVQMRGIFKFSFQPSILQYISRKDNDFVGTTTIVLLCVTQYYKVLHNITLYYIVFILHSITLYFYYHSITQNTRIPKNINNNLILSGIYSVFKFPYVSVFISPHPVCNSFVEESRLFVLLSCPRF